MLSDNMSDGLMFHTCFNAPLEWVTAHDSGVLIANIIKRDSEKDLKNKFWRQCFNIGADGKIRLLDMTPLTMDLSLLGHSKRFL